DIGKLAVPEHIISKPGRLTPEEFKKMQIHPVVGAEILATVDFPYPVVPIVRAHHERWDGSGYPHGLKGEQIPMGARILAAVDCLDALASDRQYRRALFPGAALGKGGSEGRRGGHGLRSRRDQSSPAPLPGTGGVGANVERRQAGKPECIRPADRAPSRL